MRKIEEQVAPPLPSDLDQALTGFKKAVKRKVYIAKRKRILQPVIHLFRFVRDR